MKTPEQYFEDQVFEAVNKDSGEGFSEEEKTFLDRYLGKDAQSVLKSMVQIGDGEEVPSSELIPEENAGAEDSKEKQGEGAVSEAGLAKTQEEEADYKVAEVVQMISFWLNNQEFALPVDQIKEVIRYQPPTKLPGAPKNVQGVVNLRGRVTPMIHLASLLGESGKGGNPKFVIVCLYKGLQIGLAIESIATMYRVSQVDIEWGVESSLGANSDLVEGVVKGEKKLIAIISVDRLSETLLNS